MCVVIGCWYCRISIEIIMWLMSVMVFSSVIWLVLFRLKFVVILMVVVYVLIMIMICVIECCVNLVYVLLICSSCNCCVLGWKNSWLMIVMSW